MAERREFYGEKASAVPTWAWLLQLLFLLGFLAYCVNRPLAAASSGASSLIQEIPAATAFQVLGSVPFDKNEAALTLEGQAVLDRAMSGMKGNPNVHLRVEGYGDVFGGPGRNESLSDRRTRTVAEYLRSHGIERSRLTGTGFRAEEPAASNTTVQGGANDRRVELFSQQ